MRDPGGRVNVADMTTNTEPTEGRDRRAIEASNRAAHFDRAWKISQSQGDASREGALALLCSEALDEDADRMMAGLPDCPPDQGRAPFGVCSSNGWHTAGCPRAAAMRAYWERRRANGQ